jgi:hypothetical protein
LLVRLKPNGIPDDGFEPVDDSACREFLPPKLGLNQFYSGGRIHRLFPQPDGKLLVSGECGVRTGKWDITVRNFVARLFGEPPTNSIGFTRPQFLAEAGVSSATITVWRLGDTTGPATVAYATRDNSALAGRDYVAASGTLGFAPLEVTKSFSVPLLDPDRRRQDRELSVTLANASGVDGISGPTARLVLVAPFGFQRLIGAPNDPRLTVFGSVGSTYLLETITSLESAWFDGAWGKARTSVTLTNEVQTIPDDPSWHQGWPDATAPARFYRLRRLAP